VRCLVGSRMLRPVWGGAGFGLGSGSDARLDVDWMGCKYLYG